MTPLALLRKPALSELLVQLIALERADALADGDVPQVRWLTRLLSEAMTLCTRRGRP